MEDDGIIDRHERLQPAQPEVDDDLINAEIEILYSYVEPDGSTKNMCGARVVVRTRNRIHIECVLVLYARVMNQLLRSEVKVQQTCYWGLEFIV
jgi:hypothetical protein